ncbi:MFS transporter [Streptomyces sp. ITFR-16]|uniref:MFS transporter n=1 Tax=Streptomyces sp. ITFR-16 TaxID=3075198 RepID=UPI00288A5935|nr:MFS transporter [Streptomyces sp. ITFR-16]WNI26580.1 MFS transporter [Streptomyces sp. ITFR-16]
MSAAVRPRVALLVSVAGAMIVALDGTVLLVAQPDLRRDLGADVAQVQWTSTAYLLAVAASLVVAGGLGDRYGHKRLLFLGVLGFGAASAGIALAPGIGWVIGLRAAQGVFGALLQPATLALLRLVYPAERLGAAVAVRTGAIGVAAGSGPLLGGVLVAHLGWRAVFLINVPAAIAIAALTLAVRTPKVSRSGPGRFDLVGTVLLAGTLAVLVHTLAGVPAHGWATPRTLLGLALAVALGAGLAVHQRRGTSPIVPPAVARSVPVMASMAMLLATTGGMFGALFVTTFLLQDGLGLSPLASGLRVLPMTVLMVLGAPVAAAALRGYGPRRVAVAGQSLVVLAVAGLSRLGPDSPWVMTGVGFAVLGAGFTAVMVTTTGTVVGDAPSGFAGVVGGIKQTAMNVGPTLGIAVAASMMTLNPATGVPHTAGQATGRALLVLAALAALGLLPALLLPTRTRTRPPAPAQTRAPARAPAPRRGRSRILPTGAAGKRGE